MPKILSAGCLGLFVLVYLQPFRRNSVLKCALHPKIAKKSLKTPFGGFKVVQGQRRLQI